MRTDKGGLTSALFLFMGVSVYQSELYKRIHGEVEKIKLIDTHEHLNRPHELADMGPIDFGRLFTHYLSSDLVSAGMPSEDMERVRNMESPWSVREKWQAVKPFYEKAWNTGYCECVRIAIRDLYGIGDLRDDTVDELSERMDGVDRKGWTRHVFDRAGVDLAFEQSLRASPVYARRRYPELFLYDMVENFSFFDIENQGRDAGIEVRALKDYLGVIDSYFDRFSDEASALKVSRAYDRPLIFEEVPFDEAAPLFDALLMGKEALSSAERRALEDFIIHHCIRRCGEYDLPVKFHTGLQEGNCNDIKNSRAALLINLFSKYPKTRFDIYHISWPYTEELMAISKNFQNVYIDFAWAWIFNPPAARRYLSEMLETVPANKIHGFGGDFIFVEGVYGHSVMARREISRVLAEKVEEGRFCEEYALKLARMILRENALEHFRVEEKRRVVGERASVV